MADPIAMSRDELIDERPSSSTPIKNDKPEEMDVVSPADIPRTKLQIAAILVALNVSHVVFVFSVTIILIPISSLYSSQLLIKQSFPLHCRP
jgi:hypothetical protein